MVSYDDDDSENSFIAPEDEIEYDEDSEDDDDDNKSNNEVENSASRRKKVVMSSSEEEGNGSAEEEGDNEEENSPLKKRKLNMGEETDEEEETGDNASEETDDVDKVERIQNIGKIQCKWCVKYKSPDSFSANQKKVHKNGGEAYCLDHNGVSGYNSKAVISVPIGPVYDTDEERGSKKDPRIFTIFTMKYDGKCNDCPSPSCWSLPQGTAARYYVDENDRFWFRCNDCHDTINRFIENNGDDDESNDDSYEDKEQDDDDNGDDFEVEDDEEDVYDSKRRPLKNCSASSHKNTITPSHINDINESNNKPSRGNKRIINDTDDEDDDGDNKKSLPRNCSFSNHKNTITPSHSNDINESNNKPSRGNKRTINDSDDEEVTILKITPREVTTPIRINSTSSSSKSSKKSSVIRKELIDNDDVEIISVKHSNQHSNILSPTPKKSSKIQYIKLDSKSSARKNVILDSDED
jgi:hypothetical protein